MVLITRRIEFSASHLYHNPAFSAEQNRRVFGKCNNPHGHGHNYTLEVTVAGGCEPLTAIGLGLQEMTGSLGNARILTGTGTTMCWRSPSRAMWNRRRG